MPVSNYSSGNYGAATFARSVVDGDSTITATSSISSVADRVRLGGGTVSAIVTPTVVAKIIYQSDGTASATITATADSDVVVNGDGTAAAIAALAAVNYLRIRKASGSTAPVATVTASGRHKWQDITSSTGGAWENEVDTPVVWTELESPYR
jgi:hypothetical protein